MNRAEAHALVERQARAWEQADLAAIVADFAPDGVLISPGGRWQGYDALRRAAESFFAAALDVQVVVTRVLLDGDQGAAEWTWSETNRADGRRVTIEDAIIFAVRDDQIVFWREYFDSAALHI
ncbi:MAG: nuclear transport factor 2 family protein [Kouleothrix sp.]|nr:nuclear transport factor 2 family protein [Kouleothrix sp.]